MKRWTTALILLTAIPASPAFAADAQTAPDNAHLQAGAAIYQETCTACHGGDGRGERSIFPTLAGSAVVQQKSAEGLIRAVLAGAQSVQTVRAPTGAAMPSFAWRLNDAQVADVVTYIRSSWGNQAAPVTAAMVAPIRARLRKAAGLRDLPTGN
jgi:mono/diheme cytochrome c family protein